LMARDEVGTLARLKAYRSIIDGLIASHRGRIFNTAGDSVVADFASAVDAVQFAVAVQAAISTENTRHAADEPMQFRIGVHVGDVMVDGNNLLGDGVNIAARLESLAEPGAVCVSAAARDHIGNKLPLNFADLGEQQVKNIAQAIRVYRVQTETPAMQPDAALPLPDKPSIAVLPFQNMSGDPEQEYFADGMVEEITTAIARLPWLFVIARNSSFTYKGKPIDVKQVGRELGVRYVLEGSVRKGGNRVRITGQLIDTASGAHIWADRFDGTLDDIFELQDQVASSVAGAIEPKLRHAEIDRAKHKPTESLGAYDLYLRALALRNNHTKESVRDAVALLKQALAIDPNYAPAAALIGWSYIHQSSHGRKLISEVERAEAVTWAKQALQGGKDDPDALWMSAMTLLFFAGECAVAATAVDRALMLNPNSAHAWMTRGYLSCDRGRSGAAIDALERAKRLSPLDDLGRAFTNGIAIAHLAEGRYEAALDLADQALREEPGYSGALLVKAIVCAHLDRIEEAKAAARQLTEFQPWQTVDRIRTMYSRFRSPEMVAVYVNGLRKAGLPEE